MTKGVHPLRTVLIVLMGIVLMYMYWINRESILLFFQGQTLTDEVISNSSSNLKAAGWAIVSVILIVIALFVLAVLMLTIRKRGVRVRFSTMPILGRMTLFVLALAIGICLWVVRDLWWNTAAEFFDAAFDTRFWLLLFAGLCFILFIAFASTNRQEALPVLLIGAIAGVAALILPKTIYKDGSVFMAREGELTIVGTVTMNLPRCKIVTIRSNDQLLIKAINQQKREYTALDGAAVLYIDLQPAPNCS